MILKIELVALISSSSKSSSFDISLVNLLRDYQDLDEVL